MKKEDLDKILADHKLFLESEGKEGKRADLSEADLSGANLSRADLPMKKSCSDEEVMKAAKKVNRRYDKMMKNLDRTKF